MVMHSVRRTLWLFLADWDFTNSMNFRWPKPFSGSPLCGRTILGSYSVRTFEVAAHYAVMDPGFAKVALNPKVGAPIYYFGQFFLKTAWKWKNWTEGTQMLEMVVMDSHVSNSTSLANWLWVSIFFQWLIQGAVMRVR